MAIPAGTFETYASVGIREDLTDLISNISPAETPFMSNVAKGTSKGTYHEWQIDSLEAAADNKKIEGNDATASAVTPTVRVGNYTQIADKVVSISGSDQAADSAGRTSEMAYQIAKRGLELRRDMETTLVGVNKAKASGSSGVARELAPVLSWLKTNTNHVGTDPVTADGSSLRVDGTPRAFTEAMLTDVIDKIWVSGGNPNVIMCNSTQKRAITGFTGNATKYKEVDDKKVINAVDVYVSDFGELMVVPNRFMRTRDVLVLETDMWSVDYYRPMLTNDLAKTGDNERKQLLCEYTLTSKQEAASGGIFDLS